MNGAPGEITAGFPSAIAPASPKSAYCWCSTSDTSDRYIHAVVRTFKIVPDDFVELGVLI